MDILTHLYNLKIKVLKSSDISEDFKEDISSIIYEIEANLRTIDKLELLSIGGDLESNSFTHTVSHRTISEILIEADETSDLKVLSDCWKEVVNNKYKYPLVEIEFAREHLNTLAIKMAREDSEIMKPFFDSLFNGG